MACRFTSIAVFLVICTSAGAQAPSTKPGADEPATKPAEDLLKDAVDPYNPVVQKKLFFQAAGVDNELDHKEFAALEDKPNTFRRKFDRWRWMLNYDRNGNGTLDWLEADAYRRDVRKRVLAAFDTDRNNRLTGKEREAANRALAKGRIPGGAIRRPEVVTTAAELDLQQRWAALREKHDADNDGKLSDEERAEAMREFREEMHRLTIEEFDTDGDGELSDEERAAMRQQQRERAQEDRRKWTLKFFDDDGDGEISDQEREELDKFGRSMREFGQGLQRRFMDVDGDGEISAEEREAVAREWRQVGFRMWMRTVRLMDADGNGQITHEERALFQDRMRTGMQKWMQDFAGKFDADENGRFDAEERDALMQGIREEFNGRIEAYDADEDGRLSASETEKLLIDFGKEIGLVQEQEE